MALEPFEYVIILTSLILGLGITQILTNAADMFSNLKHVKIGYAHSLLIIVVFNLHIQEWWESYHTANHLVKEWSMGMVLFVLIYPISLFTLSRMIFPTGLREAETDLDAYYYDQWPWFFSIFLLVPVISFLQNILIGGYEIKTQITQFALTVTILIFLIFRIRKRWAHVTFLSLQILIWIIWLALEDRVL